MPFLCFILRGGHLIHNTNLMTIRPVFIYLCFLSVLSAAAQGVDDNVHIVNCVDRYKFKVNSDGIPVISNTTDLEYGVTKYAALVQPNVYYGDFIRLDKASSKGTAQYKSATPENIFFDDTKVCYFNYRIPKVGKTLKASFARTFIDPVYFTRISFPEDYYVENKTVQVVIPKALSQYHLKECNLPADVVKTAVADEAGDSVFTYVMHGLSVPVSEEGAPAWGYTVPHLLVIGSFKDEQDMFAWSKKMADVDCTIPNQAEILAEIAQGAKSDKEKIANTFAWVQSHIRYLAYEAGVSAHQPATPAETIRKRYGDCKAMSLLLKTLLKAQGFDARQTDIGTDDIPYTSHEVPTISSVNHAICTVFYQGKPYYLDATNSYIPLGYIPTNIQGRQALVEEGEGCRVYTLPTLPQEACSSSVEYDCALSVEKDGNYAMKGTLNSSWKGDMKAMVLSAYDAAAQDDRQQFLSRLLGMDGNKDEMRDVVLKGSRPQDEQLAISSSFYKGNVGVSADQYLYVDMNQDKDVWLEKVDTAKRVSDYMIGMKLKNVRKVSLSVPKGMRVQELPAPFASHTHWADLSCTFSKQGNRVVMKKEYVIKNRRVALKDIPAWNKMVSEWNDACNQQVVILTK